jgi:tRNA threonylcarbamoyladenosine modification (KEOPS) complex Cgi121 subunit
MWTSGIKGTNWFVTLGGFRVSRIIDPRALVKTITEATSPHTAQILDATKVSGKDHLYMAAVNAAKSMETGMAVSKSIAVEALLYASTQDQIMKALAMMGLKVGSTDVALIVFANSRDDAEKAYVKAAEVLGKEDDSVLEMNKEKAVSLRKAYGIGDEELDAAGGQENLSRLIIERGALLSLHR